jgi:hypothetical protein
MYNLISTITELPKLIGCADFPNSPQGMGLIKMIQDFINSEYRYTGAQVKEAFTMAVKRELYLDGKRVDPSTFGQHLSVNVVGQVLTAYKEHKRVGRARPGYNPNQLPEFKKKPIAPAEAHDMILEWIKKDGELPAFAPYNIAYLYLLEKGQVKPVSEETSRMRLMGANVEVSAKRKAAEDWYKRNAV